MPEPVFEIIGVVADIRNQGLEEATVPEVFLPLTVGSFSFPRILVRTSVEPHGLVSAVRSELQAINKNLVRQEPTLLDDLIAKYSLFAA